MYPSSYCDSIVCPGKEVGGRERERGAERSRSEFKWLSLVQAAMLPSTATYHIVLGTPYKMCWMHSVRMFISTFAEGGGV